MAAGTYSEKTNGAPSLLFLVKSQLHHHCPCHIARHMLPPALACHFDALQPSFASRLEVYEELHSCRGLKFDKPAGEEATGLRSVVVVAAIAVLRS